jgi:hypothetical protein
VRVRVGTCGRAGSHGKTNICSVLDGGGVTAPDQRIEAALRLIPEGW